MYNITRRATHRVHVEGELVSESSPAPVLDHLRKSKKLSLARIVVHRLVADLAKVFDPE